MLRTREQVSEVCFSEMNYFQVKGTFIKDSILFPLQCSGGKEGEEL